MTSFCGHSKVDVSPKSKLSLAGYAHRKGSFECIKENIWVRVLYLKKDVNCKKLIISADIIWWDSKITDELKKNIAQSFSISKAKVNKCLFSRSSRIFFE